MSIPNTSLADNALDARHALAGWTGTQGGAGVAACYGGHIQYALPDAGQQLTLATNSLLSYQNTNRFDDLNSWTITKVADAFPAALRTRFRVDSPISVASVGDYNYFFWGTKQDSTWAYYALRTSPDMLAPPALATIDVHKAPASENDVCYGNLACFALPAGRPELTGNIGCVVPYSELGYPGACHLRMLVLTPSAFVANSTWPVACYNDSTASLSDLLGPNSNSYQTITAGWYDQGSGVVNFSDDNITRNVSLAVWLSTGTNNATVVLDLTAAFVKDYNWEINATDRVVGTVMSRTPSVAQHTSVALCQAPDGQLLALYLNSSSAVKYVVFVPASGTQEASWQPYAPMADVQSMASANTPAAVFVPLASAVGDSPVPVKSAGGGEKMTYKGCHIQNYVQCVFTSDNSSGSTRHQPQFGTAYWGCFFTIPGYSQHRRISLADPTATADNTSPGAGSGAGGDSAGSSDAAPNPGSSGNAQMLAALVADTFPYPVPDPNIWGADSPSGMVNWLLCEYEYLVGDENEVDIDYTLRASIGVKAESTILVGGLGARGEGSLAAGFSLATRYADVTRKATSFSVITKGFPHTLSDTPSTTPDALPVTAAGTVFGSPPPATIFVDLALVLKRGAKDISGTMATVLRPTLDATSVSAASEFATYCYTPGNLLSYQEEVINHRMRKLFYGLDGNQQAEFNFNGRNYGRFYGQLTADQLYQENYVQEVVNEFGTQCFGPDGNLPYLEFAFSETGIQRSSFQTTSAFTAGGSAFIDGSRYSGLAVGADTSISFGILGCLDLSLPLASVSGYVMLGCEVSTELAASGTTSNEWGINLGEYLNPLGPGESYTVRLYLLKPSPLWARELENFGGLPASVSIDTTNSAPVRILFTVPYISDTLKTRLEKLFPGSTDLTS